MLSTENREFELKRELKTVTSELTTLNYELAVRLLTLSIETEDVAPLYEAVDALSKTQGLYSVETMSHDYVDVHKQVADGLLAFGRESDDPVTLEYAIKAYRSAITLASLLSDDRLRKTAKRNYALASELLGAISDAPLATATSA